MRCVNLFILLAACASCAGAEDISTTNGEVFNNAEIIRFEADGLVVRHDGGTNRIAWKELPAAARQRYRAEARKQKEKEVQRLKQDLARAESEAARLEQDEGQPESKNRPQAETSANSATRRRTAEGHASRVADLPPLKPDEIVDAADLVRQFKDDPPWADRRYHNKTFRVKGVIERFEPKMFVRKYDVLFESPDKFIRIVAIFDYPNDYRTVFTTQRGQALVGKPAPNKEVTLMQAGQTLVLRGKCKGARDAEIVFTGCAFVR